MPRSRAGDLAVRVRKPVSSLQEGSECKSNRSLAKSSADTHYLSCRGSLGQQTSRASYGSIALVMGSTQRNGIDGSKALQSRISRNKLAPDQPLSARRAEVRGSVSRSRRCLRSASIRSRTRSRAISLDAPCCRPFTKARGCDSAFRLLGTP